MSPFITLAIALAIYSVVPIAAMVVKLQTNYLEKKRTKESKEIRSTLFDSAIDYDNENEIINEIESFKEMPQVFLSENANIDEDEIEEIKKCQFNFNNQDVEQTNYEEQAILKLTIKIKKRKL